MEKYVILERDGVLNVRMDHPVTSKEHFWLLPFVEEFSWNLLTQGMKAVVLVSDDAVHTGEMTRQELNEIHEILFDYLGDESRNLFHIELCSETKTNGELCFPSPQILQSCAQKFRFDLSETFYICSRIESFRAGWAVDCKTAFVRSGKPYRTLQALTKSPQKPDLVERDLLDAILKIERLTSSQLALA